MLATSTETFSAQHSITMTCTVKGPLQMPVHIINLSEVSTVIQIA